MSNQVNQLDDAARFFVYLAVASLAFSPVLVNLGLLGLLICAVCSRTFWSAGRELIRNPFVQLSLFAFGFLVAGVLWTEVNAASAWGWVSKYKKLLFVPLAMPFFVEDKARHKLLWVLFWALLVSVLLTIVEHYATLFGLYQGMLGGGSKRITLSVLHDFLFMLAILLARESKNLRQRFALYAVACLVVVEVFAVLTGRTGQVILIILFSWLFISLLLEQNRTFKNKLQIVGLASALFIVGTSFITFSKESRLREVIEKVIEHKVEAFKPGTEAVSLDVRLIFYKSALEVISNRPIAGWGTGGHVPAYADVASRGENHVARIPITNPHNEFLLWTSQLGLLGALTFSAWLIAGWIFAGQMKDALMKQALRGWWLIFMIGCTMNSFLLDFSEGYMSVLIAACLLPMRMVWDTSKKNIST
jgi:O-antigen ligase